MFYTLIKHGFLTNQSARRVLSMLQSIITKHREYWQLRKRDLRMN